MSRVESTPEWSLEKLSTKIHETVIKITAVLLGIWFVRNKKVWKNQVLTPAVAMKWSSKQIFEWREAQKKHIILSCENGSSNQQNVSKWSAPATGPLKLNVDASVFSGASSFSIDMVLRDDKGRFVKDKSMNVEGDVSMLEAESLKVCEALSWIIQETNRPVSIESDSLQTMNALIKNVHYRLVVGHIQ